MAASVNNNNNNNTVTSAQSYQPSPSTLSLYQLFCQKVPDLENAVTPASLDPASTEFAPFYQNTLLKWLVTTKTEASVTPRDTAQEVKAWLQRHFPHDPELICVYPGGQMDLTTPYKFCDPDVLVIVDPQPLPKPHKSLQEVSERFCTKIKEKNGEILECTQDTSSRPLCKIVWRNLETNKTYRLYILCCFAGQEQFPGSPLEHGAQIMVSRLPTFDTSVSFPTVKNEGLILYFTPVRDGKKLLGTVWNSLYDQRDNPHILKKSEIFTDQKIIATIELLSKSAELFYEQKGEQEFLQAFSEIKTVLRTHYPESSEAKIRSLQQAWSLELQQRLTALKTHSAFLIENRLLPQECLEQFERDVQNIAQIYQRVINSLNLTQ